MGTDSRYQSRVSEASGPSGCAAGMPMRRVRLGATSAFHAQLDGERSISSTLTPLRLGVAAPRQRLPRSRDVRRMAGHRPFDGGHVRRRSLLPQVGDRLQLIRRRSPALTAAAY